MTDKFYTVRELASILKISDRTLTSLIKRNIIDAANVGTEKRALYRIYEGQYLKFLSESYTCEDED